MTDQSFVELATFSIIVVYVAVSLTIPFWVPLIKRHAGETGFYWVFATLTYYAYLAWVIFAALLAFALVRQPVLGGLWLLLLLLRVVQFSRLCLRSPAHLLEAHDGKFLSPSLSEGRAASPELGGALGRWHGISSQGKLSDQSSCGRGLGRVVLVGNGPSIREKGLGNYIDSFDCVVRFNSFVSSGLEQHTGGRTSIWCHMMQWYHVPAVEVAQRAATSWFPTCYAWNHVVLAPLMFVPAYLMPMLPSCSSITWSPRVYWKAHRLIGLRLHQVPSTGFVMLIRLLEEVSCVHLIGFDGYSQGGELHYYKEGKKLLQVNAAGALLHDWSKEQLAIKTLACEGRVVLL